MGIAWLNPHIWQQKSALMVLTKIHKRKQIQVKASLCCALLLLIIHYVRLGHNSCNVCSKHAAVPKLLIKEVKKGRLTSVVKQ